jgi:adenylosuccinate synthase
VKTWEELPEACRRYVERLAEVIGAPCDIISVGPSRDQTIFRRLPY